MLGFSWLVPLVESYPALRGQDLGYRPHLKNQPGLDRSNILDSIGYIVQRDQEVCVKVAIQKSGREHGRRCR